MVVSQTHKIPITCKELDELINNFPQLAQKLENIEQQLANLLYNEIKITKFSNNVITAENGSTVNKITFSCIKQPVGEQFKQRQSGSRVIPNYCHF